MSEQLVTFVLRTARGNFMVLKIVEGVKFISFGCLVDLLRMYHKYCTSYSETWLKKCHKQSELNICKF